MRWASYTYLVATATAGQAQYLNLSDLEAPSSMDTHDPRNYALWANRYSRYQVLGVKYKITFRTRNYQDSPTFEGRPILVYCYPHQNTYQYIAQTGFPTTTAYETFIETTCMNRSVRCATVLRTTYNSTLPDKATFKGFVRTRDLYEEGWEQYSGVYGFNPSNSGPYLTFGFTDMNGTIFADCGMDILIRVKYIVRNWQPKTLTQET